MKNVLFIKIITCLHSGCSNGKILELILYKYNAKFYVMKFAKTDTFAALFLACVSLTKFANDLFLY